MNLKYFINLATICLAIGVAIFFASKSCERSQEQHSKEQQERQAQLPHFNYTPEICDDAFSSEVHHDDELIPYFDVKLKEGCFGGFVGLPKRWFKWQGQLLHNDPKAWVAEWWKDSPNPFGPWSAAQLNSGNTGLNNFWAPSTYVRLQGRGTMRFYCVTAQLGGCPELKKPLNKEGQEEPQSPQPTTSPAAQGD